jgi:hypothetical protein
MRHEKDEPESEISERQDHSVPVFITVNFFVASACIHDFHAKKILPFNSPFFYFASSRKNPPISQQINASTCNDQLRPPIPLQFSRPSRRPDSTFSS